MILASWDIQVMLLEKLCCKNSEIDSKHGNIGRCRWWFRVTLLMEEIRLSPVEVGSCSLSFTGRYTTFQVVSRISSINSISYVYLGLAPTNNSHHRDCDIFSRGFLYTFLFSAITGKGTVPNVDPENWGRMIQFHGRKCLKIPWLNQRGTSWNGVRNDQIGSSIG